MKKQLLFVLLFSCLAFGQGVQNIKGTSGSGAPSSTLVPGDVGSQYVDLKTGNLYVCTAITRTANALTCSWSQVGGSGGGTATAIGAAANPVATTAATQVGQYEAWNAAGTSFDLLGQPTFDAQAYGLNPNGSTNNATAMAALFAASNATTLGNPVVHFGCVPGTGCQYNFNAGAGVSPFNPTIPTTVVCNPGVTLNVTGGSAHAFDWGPTGLSSSTYVNQEYRMTGCRQTYSGGSSLTAGNYFNNYLVWITLDHNFFYNCPGHASSTVYCAIFSGYNWDIDIHDNRFEVDNNTALNQVQVIPGGGTDQNSQTRLHDNHLVCINGAHGLTGCTTPGVGVWLDAAASQVENNNCAFFLPCYRLGSQGPYTVIGPGNYLEAAVANNAPMIQFGDPTDGAATAVDGLQVSVHYCNGQGKSGSVLMAPTTANNLLTNFTIEHVRCVNYPTANPLVKLNNTAGQTGNKAYDTYATSGFGPVTPATLLHTQGDSIANWQYVGQASFADSFVRSDGALVAPWTTDSGGDTTPTIATNVLSCASGGCPSYHAVDIADNQRASITITVVPTGTGQAGVLTRMSGAATVTGYQCVYVNGTGTQLYKVVANGYTQLGSTYSATSPAVGSVLEMESIGTVHSCYLDGKLIIRQVDTTIASGFPGLVMVGTVVRLGPFTAKGLQ